MCVCALCGSYSELAFHCMPNAQHGLAPKTALSRAQLQALLPVPQTSWLSMPAGPRLCSPYWIPPVRQASSGGGGSSASPVCSLGLLSSAAPSHLTSNVAKTQSQSPLPASVVGPISPAGGLCPHQQLLCLTCQPSFHVTHTPTESSHWCGSEAAWRAGTARWRWSR